MKTQNLVLGLVALVVLSLAASVSAEVPQMINYQGVLTNAAGCPQDGDYTMIFSIYDAPAGGNLLWDEEHDTVKVTQGNFSVLLGSINPAVDPIPYSLFLNDSLWLAVKVGNDPEMTPRQRIASVGYAFHSQFADTADHCLTASDGDWTIDGINIYREQGYVGIGTTAPARKLHLSNGTGACVFRMQDTRIPGVTMDMTAGANFASIQVAGDNPFAIGTNGLARVSVGGDGNVDFYGNVDVSGTAQMTGFVMPPGADSGYVLTSDGSGEGTWQQPAGGSDNDWTISGNDMFSAVSGNVGIGIVSPSAKLDVNGSIYTEGGDGDANLDGIVTVGDLLAILHYLNGSTSFTNEQIAHADFDGDGRVTWDDHGMLSTRLFSRETRYEATRKIHAVYGALDSSTFYVGGKVGIGRTTPTERLDVAGTVQMIGFKMPTGASAGKVLTSDVFGEGTWETAPGGIGGGGTTNYVAKFTGTTTIGSSAIFDTGGDIGIGTDDPDARLHVLDTTANAWAAMGVADGGSGTKYGGRFLAVNHGYENIGLYARGGCLGLPAHPASRSNIGIWAEDGSSGGIITVPLGNWAGCFNGDVRIVGDLELKGSVKFQYDSTFSISVGDTKTLTHNLGGDSTKYIVTMYGISSSGGVHQANYGTNYLPVNKWIGCEWDQLTSTTIRVTRGANDDETVASKQWNQVILRILKNQ